MKWIMFKYESGANPYIAFNEKEAKRIKRKYKDKVIKIKEGIYLIKDINENFAETF